MRNKSWSEYLNEYRQSHTLYTVYVYGQGFGYDVYTVEASSEEEAKQRARERLDSELDNPEAWTVESAYKQ